MMAEVLDGLATQPDDNEATESAVRKRVIALCRQFPIYGGAA